jgi:hypothetical protein
VLKKFGRGPLCVHSVSCATADCCGGCRGRLRGQVQALGQFRRFPGAAPIVAISRARMDEVLGSKDLPAAGGGGGGSPGSPRSAGGVALSRAAEAAKRLEMPFVQALAAYAMGRSSRDGARKQMALARELFRQVGAKYHEALCSQTSK